MRERKCTLEVGVADSTSSEAPTWIPGSLVSRLDIADMDSKQHCKMATTVVGTGKTHEVERAFNLKVKIT